MEGKRRRADKRIASVMPLADAVDIELCAPIGIALSIKPGMLENGHNFNS